MASQIDWKTDMYVESQSPVRKRRKLGFLILVEKNDFVVWELIYENIK